MPHKPSLVRAWATALLFLVAGTLPPPIARADTGTVPAAADAVTLPAVLDAMLAKLLAAEGGTRPDKIRVIVGDFPCGNAGNEGFSTVSRVLEDEVGAAVTRRKDVELITREKLGELLAEKKLNDLDFLDPQTPAGKVNVKAAELLVRGHYLYAYPSITVKLEGVKLHGATVIAALTEKLPLGLFPCVDVLPKEAPKALVDNVLPQKVAETRTNRESVAEISRKLPNRDIPVELWVTGGRTNFQEGERITFSVRAAVECHIAVFCHQIDGSTVVLFPNTHSSSTRVAKDKIVSIPSEEKDRFYIEITPPFGGDIVQVIACTRKSALTGILKDAKAAAGALYATLSRGELARGMQAVGTGDAGAGGEDDSTVHGPTQYGETRVVVNTYPSAMTTRGQKVEPANPKAGGTQVRGAINVNPDVNDLGDTGVSCYEKNLIKNRASKFKDTGGKSATHDLYIYTDDKAVADLTGAQVKGSTINLNTGRGTNADLMITATGGSVVNTGLDAKSPKIKGVKINVNNAVDIVRAADSSKVYPGLDLGAVRIKDSTININSASAPKRDPLATNKSVIDTGISANNASLKNSVVNTNTNLGTLRAESGGKINTGAKLDGATVENAKINVNTRVTTVKAAGGTDLNLGTVTDDDERPLPAFSPGFWLVEKFDEKAGWLEKHPTIAALWRDWGALLTDKVKDALQGKAEPATALDRKVSKDEIPALVRKGMEYLCGGTIEALALTTVDGRTTAELVTTYALSRRQGATVKLVQKERLRTPRPTPPEISAADLEELINATATQIADRVVTGTVQDVMALRDAGSGK